MITFTNFKNGLASLCVIGVASILVGCSKSAPPPQPPVVINLNGGSGVTATPVDKAPQKGNTASRASENIKLQAPSSTPVTPAVPHYTQEQPTPIQQNPEPVRLDEASFLNTQIHEIALQLLRNFRDDAGPNGPVAVATFVDLNNLYRTSPFGRYIAEQLMGELQRAGFNVVEIRKADSIMVKPRFGEYGLSRDIQELARQSSARYILAGTYVTRGRYIMINARLISNENNLVASSGLKILRKDPFLERLLWPSATPETVPAVRVPVKELGSLSDMKILSGS